MKLLTCRSCPLYTSCFSFPTCHSSPLCFHTCPWGHVLSKPKGQWLWMGSLNRDSFQQRWCPLGGSLGSHTNTVPSKAAAGAQARLWDKEGGRQGQLCSEEAFVYATLKLSKEWWHKAHLINPFYVDRAETLLCQHKKEVNYACKKWQYKIQGCQQWGTSPCELHVHINASAEENTIPMSSTAVDCMGLVCNTETEFKQDFSFL